MTGPAATYSDRPAGRSRHSRGYPDWPVGRVDVRRQEPGVAVSEPGAASRSARLRRMQNSLPSGSARMTQPVPGPYCPRWSATSTAPCSSSRASSSSRLPSTGSRSRWMRFLPDLPSGHLDEEQLVAAVAAEDHALLVAREVGVALDVGVVEHALPPLGERVRVAAVDGRVGHPCGHPATLPLWSAFAPSGMPVATGGRPRVRPRWQPGSRPRRPRAGPATSAQRPLPGGAPTTRRRRRRARRPARNRSP